MEEHSEGEDSEVPSSTQGAPRAAFISKDSDIVIHKTLSNIEMGAASLNRYEPFEGQVQEAVIYFPLGTNVVTGFVQEASGIIGQVRIHTHGVALQANANANRVECRVLFSFHQVVSHVAYLTEFRYARHF